MSSENGNLGDKMCYAAKHTENHSVLVGFWDTEVIAVRLSLMAAAALLAAVLLL